LISKMVLAGFIAAWFFAASPINRSSGVKETKDGVVKLPCSLATIFAQYHSDDFSEYAVRTDFDAVALVHGDTGIGGT
jgi:hypothetical protein